MKSLNTKREFNDVVNKIYQDLRSDLLDAYHFKYDYTPFWEIEKQIRYDKFGVQVQITRLITFAYNINRNI